MKARFPDLRILVNGQIETVGQGMEGSHVGVSAFIEHFGLALGVHPQELPGQAGGHQEAPLGVSRHAPDVGSFGVEEHFRLPIRDAVSTRGRVIGLDMRRCPCGRSTFRRP